jgi:hypothetical protein
MKFAKLAPVAAAGLLAATLVATPTAPAQAFCGPLLPLCVAGAVVAGAATIATLPLAAAAAATYPYPGPYPYYAPSAAYYPGPAYYAPGLYPGYYGYRPYWHAHYAYGPRFHRRWRHY